MPSLRDKIRLQAEEAENEADKETAESKKGKGRRIKSKTKK